MNYTEARVYLDKPSKYGSVLGLKRMNGLPDRSGNAREVSLCLRMSGTNGTGPVRAHYPTVLPGRRPSRFSPAVFPSNVNPQTERDAVFPPSLPRRGRKFVLAEGRIRP